MSLVCGIRLKAGGCNRNFSAEDKTDRFGSLINSQVYKNPGPIQVSIGYPIIPHSIRFMSKEPNVPLNDAAPYLDHIIKIKDKKKYTAVIRAAKNYSDALWFAENDPNHSWIMLVSAIESAANSWKKNSYNNVDIFKEERSSLYKKLSKSCKDQSVIKEIATLLHPKTAKKFVDFIDEFHGRPQRDRKILKIGKVDWRNYKKMLEQIYNLRCLSGLPFPPEMCNLPYINYKKNYV